MAKAAQIAQRFIAEAEQNPDDRPEIFRKAAVTFMGLAQDPKNGRSAKQLANLGMEFAASARKARPPTMDDFVDILQETQQAYDEVGDDPMDLVARRREIHDERTPQLPGQVLITPESFGRDATLGRSAKIKFAPTPEEIAVGILQSVNVAFWQGTKKEAQAMTVDISLGFLPASVDTDLIQPGNTRPYAEVEFGSDGNRTLVKLDVGLGKRVTVVGNYIAVTIGMDPPGFGDPSREITAGASIGAFAAPSQSPTILTSYVDAIPGLGGSSDLIPIPLKATTLLPVMSTLAGGASSNIEFLDIGGNGVGSVFFTNSAATPMGPVPIPGDAAYVRVNNSSMIAANYRLPFQLAI